MHEVILVLTPFAIVAMLVFLVCGEAVRFVSREETSYLVEAAVQTQAAPPREAPVETPANRKRLGEGVFLEINGDHRRVVVEAQVCLRSGEYGLECLLCKSGTKEHESILRTKANAEIIHAALLACRAEPGSHVQFTPEFKSPSGTRIKVSLQFQRDGKTVAVPAQDWVRNSRTKKVLEHDWVFAGSILWKDPEEPNRPPVYTANSEGAYISITNVPTAILDLPVNSPKSLEDRSFEPFTERIPALESRVEVILDPIPSKAALKP